MEDLTRWVGRVESLVQPAVLGRVCRSHEVEGAEEAFVETKAVTKRARSAWVLSCLAVLFFVFFLGQLAQGAVESSSHLQRSATLISQGDLPGAEREARLALKQPSTRAVEWATLGTIRLRQKRFRESTEFPRGAAQLNPRLLSARLNLGQAYVVQGKTASARQVFTEALRIDPSNPNARFSLAQVEADSGNYETSLEVVKPIAALLRGSPEDIYLLTTDYLGVGRREDARALVSRWMVTADASSVLSTNYASLLLRYDRKKETISVLEKVKRAGPPSLELASSFAGSYLLNGGLNTADENCEMAVGLKPDCVPCYAQLAGIARRERDTEKALAT